SALAAGSEGNIDRLPRFEPGALDPRLRSLHRRRPVPRSVCLLDGSSKACLGHRLGDFLGIGLTGVVRDVRLSSLKTDLVGGDSNGPLEFQLDRGDAPAAGHALDSE